MTPKVSDYEKLGVFYLGREYDLDAMAAGDGLMLYDSKDLVTHGVVLGMTGSGKTGLCLAVLEEAAMDGIPAVIIDPKGDIANLLLTFPELRPEDFRPWINEDEARRKGVEPDEHAVAQAELWKNGLARSGQDGERIRKMREQVDMAIYTPGSNAGLPISILSSLECPPPEVVEDTEIFAERIESTVASLLAMVGLADDPLQSRAHLFLSALFEDAWSRDLDLDLEGLIGQMQHPPFQKVGVMPLESFFPEKDRMELAMRLNSLLAAPGFEVWLQGEALDIQRVLYTESGKPRVAIFSIAHLGDAERMFFVSLLLNQMVAWMRSQAGTTSLRALLYMDEIAGYLPPSANPPSKKPMMTLLKQARAFGLGVLLATQNPVDLDYKALSNIGTWFLGRLQTERDKARVLDGLEGAASSQGAGFDRARMEKILASLGNRVFLMNNVHEDRPQTFEVRWVMSYLRGPMARQEIKALADPMRGRMATPPAKAAVSGQSRPGGGSRPEPGEPTSTLVKPKVDARVDEFFLPLPAAANPAEYVYEPRVLRAGRVVINEAKLGIEFTHETCMLAPIDSRVGDADWAAAEALDDEVTRLPRLPERGVAYRSLPTGLAQSAYFTGLKAAFVDELSREGGVTLWRSPSLGEYSQPGESERDFRLRMVQRAREARDERVALLRDDYAKRLVREQAEVVRAQTAVEREKQQASQSKWAAITSAGAGLLGALLGGGRKLSATNLRRVGSAGGAISRSMNQASDVGRATERLASELADVAALEAELAEKINAIERTLDPVTETLVPNTLKPLRKNISITALGLAWVPVLKTA